ncbi:MAG: PEP-CTERM sorting domain-containing protein, partial [Armatimonadia bacterium]|nr:PEP-CTERM sorting domain-containing protein [Armatimonadia bacterium]
GGCAPTSWGMIIGYWNEPGQFPFYDGDATVWSGAKYDSDPAQNEPYGTAAMVASWEHVDEGRKLGYNTSLGRGKYTNHAANCIADFMYVDDGNCFTSLQAPGIIDFAAWDNPETTFNESVEASAGREYADPDATVEPLFTFVMGEIDAGRPMATDWFCTEGGHTVAVYGYLDGPGSADFVAVRDTWSDGLNQGPSGSYIDGSVEWWPWRADDQSYSGSWDWKVRYGNYFHPTRAPEPATVALFLIGVAGIGFKLRNRREDD